MVKVPRDSISGPSISRRLAAIAVVAAITTVLTSCASSNTSNSSASTAPTASSSVGGGLAAAKQVLDGYTGHPSAFPIVDKLKKIPTGARIAFADCGNPECAQIYTYVQTAAKQMGVSLTRYAAGPTPALAQSGFNSIVASKPDAVIATAVPLELWSRQAKALQAAKIPVVGAGVIGGAAYGFVSPQEAESAVKLQGKLLAAYVAVNRGKSAHVVYYNLPELSFSPIEKASFLAELAASCPGCTVRSVDIPIATIGTSSPQTIALDLKSHPDTNAVVYSVALIATGVPAALRQEGINVKSIGLGPDPVNMEYIKNGQETAGLGFDTPVYAWSLVDQAARLIDGQKLSGDEAAGLSVPLQFLGKSDITFDPNEAWTGYPDYASRFATLWGTAK